MGAPTKQIYFFSPSTDWSGLGYPGVQHGLMRNFASPAVENWGWRYGNISAPRWVQMSFNNEVDFVLVHPSWSLSGPTGSVPNPGLGDCYVAGPLDGTFNAGEWGISMSLHGETASPGGSVNLNFRFWKAVNPTASGAIPEVFTAITESYFTSSVASLVIPTVNRNVTASFTLPEFNMRNEFLFLQVYLHLITSSGNSGAQVHFNFFASSSLRSAPFMSHKGTAMAIIQEEQDPYLIDFTNAF